MRVICQGNYRRFGLRIRGKRNALGLTLNPRSCIWQSGTCQAFAVIFRSNSHTAPNYRLPPRPEYHDDELCERNCGRASKGLLQVMSKVAQRAQAESTHYYCGYTYKGVRVGKYELKAIARLLNFVREGMKGSKTGKQWHRISSRTLQDMHHRSTIRVITEETNLSANLDPQDATAAEFTRTFRTKTFPGKNLVMREEAERSAQDPKHDRLRVVPTPSKRYTDMDQDVIKLKNFEDFYGYRGNDPRVYYLSPWEFTMYWEPVALEAPSSNSGNMKDLTEWIEIPDTGSTAQPGVHYRVKNTIDDDFNYVIFPDAPPLREVFRHTWILRRCVRPFVPQPHGTPMPDRAEDRMERSRLYSIYLRPWVLDPACDPIS